MWKGKSSHVECTCPMWRNMSDAYKERERPYCRRRKVVVWERDGHGDEVNL